MQCFQGNQSYSSAHISAVYSYKSRQKARLICVNILKHYFFYNQVIKIDSPRRKWAIVSAHHRADITEIPRLT